MIDELDNLAQAIEIQQVVGNKLRIVVWWSSVAGRTHGDGCVRAVGEPNNEVWINTPTDTNNLNLLPAERMLGVGDRHPSRRTLG